MVTNSYYVPGTALTPITLAKAKKQLRLEVDFTEEDDLIQSYIDSALIIAENYINRALSPRKFVLEMDRFENPFQFSQNNIDDTIDKVEYFAPGETEASLLADTEYKARTSIYIECKEIKFKTTPTTDSRDDAVIITINQGFTSATDIPKPIVQAMLLIISDMYERRDDKEIGTNSAANALMRPYRKY